MNPENISTKKKWRRTIVGLTCALYEGIAQRCEIKWGIKPPFTAQVLRKWFIKKGGLELYKKWVKSGYQRDIRPSIDRKDCLKGYNFSNMQVITYQENILKGRLEKEILWGKRVKQKSLKGKLITEFSSSKEAERKTGVPCRNIQQAARRRGYAGGFLWEYVFKEKFHRTKYV